MVLGVFSFLAFLLSIDLVVVAAHRRAVVSRSRRSLHSLDVVLAVLSWSFSLIGCCVHSFILFLIMPGVYCLRVVVIVPVYSLLPRS